MNIIRWVLPNLKYHVQWTSFTNEDFLVYGFIDLIWKDFCLTKILEPFYIVMMLWRDFWGNVMICLCKYHIWNIDHDELQTWWAETLLQVLPCKNTLCQMNALVNTRSISWLLMPWLLTSPGHQQPWYWLCRVCSCLIWGRISTTWVVSMWRNDTKCKYMFTFPLKNLARKAPDTFIDIDVWIKVLGVGVKKCCSYLKAFIKALIWHLF